MAQIIAEQKVQGLSQEDLATAAGVGREAINASLKGRSAFKLPTLLAVCDLLGVPLDEIIRRAESQVG